MPGRWATPLGGLVAASAATTAAMLGRHGRPGAALGLTVAAGALLVAGGRAIARRVNTLPWMRSSSINLVAMRGIPRVWLVAHLDSKSQPVAMLARIAGIVTGGATLVAIAALATVSARGVPVPPMLWTLLGVLAVVASLPVIASIVGDKSPGALDNGSGVVAVLLAAEMLPRDMPIGVLLTSAEELGMAGARAFAIQHAAAMAINVDGVDDRGATICMRHGRAARVRVGLSRAARAIGMRVDERRTIPGLLTDGVVLAEAGWSAVTLSRGGLRTLWRIHRAADIASRITGRGIHEMARLVASAAREIA